MKTTIKYLDEAKEKLGIKADRNFANAIGVTPAAISSYRVYRTVMDDFTAAQIARILGLEAIMVIAAANVEREKDEKKKEFWQKYYERLGGLAASIIFAVTLIVTPTPSQAAPVLKADVSNMYIMLNS